MIFNKTGTLTEGDNTLIKFSSAVSSDTDRTFAQIAAFGGFFSRPAVRAIMEAAKGLTLPDVWRTEVASGRGVNCEVEGAQIYLG